MIFHDRRDAGRALAAALREQALPSDAVVLALPRGGVPVGFEVACELRLPLDIFIVRKLGVPGQDELAMGALAAGGILVLNSSIIHAFNISRPAVDAVVARERREIERRESTLRACRRPIPIAGRTAVLVDDGIATGSTMRAAIAALRPSARSIIVAVPVAAASICEELRGEASLVVCLHCPERFIAVGAFYRHFEQTSDDEVRALLSHAWQPPPADTV